MTLKVLLAEDIPATREAIALRIGKHPALEVVATFSSVAETTAFLLAGNQVDALFLDIRLEDDYAWEILSQLRENDKSIPPVVLITAEEEKGYAETVFKNFSDDVVDYFVKPFGKKWRERREDCVAKIKNHLLPANESAEESSSLKYLELHQGSTTRIIPVEKITHIIKVNYSNEEFALPGLYFFTTKQREPYYGQKHRAISKVEQMIQSASFIRGGRDCLINHTYVDAFARQDRSKVAIMRPFGHAIIISEDGENRLREGMGLL